MAVKIWLFDHQCKFCQTRRDEIYSLTNKISYNTCTMRKDIRGGWKRKQTRDSAKCGLCIKKVVTPSCPGPTSDQKNVLNGRPASKLLRRNICLILFTQSNCIKWWHSLTVLPMTIIRLGFFIFYYLYLLGISIGGWGWVGGAPRSLFPGPPRVS